MKPKRNVKKGGEETEEYISSKDCYEIRLFKELTDYYDRKFKPIYEEIKNLCENIANGNLKRDYIIREVNSIMTELDNHIETINSRYLEKQAFKKLPPECNKIKKTLEEFNYDYNKDINKARLDLFRIMKPYLENPPAYAYNTYSIKGGKSKNEKGGSNKVHIGPKNGKYVIVMKDGKRVKKYITK